MQIQRCPECGGRLKTNYCDICLRKVPFKGVPVKQTWDSSSAHREEAHTCIEFDEAPKKAKPVRQVRMPRQKKTPTGAVKKKGTVIGIFLAVMSVIAPLFGLVEDAIDSVSPEPEYNFEAYVAADESSAEAVPGIQPMELYNDGEIVITADSAGLYYDDYTISLTIQNGSKQDINVNTELLSVNGYMVSDGLYAEVAAGETAQAFLTLYSYELEQAGITQIAEIAFYLNLYETNDYTEIATTELLTIETDIAGEVAQAVDVSGWELYNDGGVAVRLRGVELSSYGDCDINVYIENLSDKTVSVSTSAIWLNGQEVSGHLWNTLRPGTRAVSSAYIYDLEEMDITGLAQIEELSLDLHIEYMEDWYVEQTLNETVTFDPNALPN